MVLVNRRSLPQLRDVNLHTLSLKDPEAAQIGANISRIWNDDGQLHILSPGELLNATWQAQAQNFYMFSAGPQYAQWYAGVLERLHHHAQLGAPLNEIRTTEQYPLPSGGSISIESTDPSGQSRAAIESSLKVVSALALAPAWRKILAKTTLKISPPGEGLGALFGPDHDDFEGVAYPTTNPGGAQIDTAIRHDSISRWNEGLIHEFLHLFMHELRHVDPQAGARMDADLEALVNKYQPQTDPDHLIVYLAQYALNGRLDVVKDELNQLGFGDIADFISAHLPDAQVHDRALPEPLVRTAVKTQLERFGLLRS